MACYFEGDEDEQDCRNDPVVDLGKFICQNDKPREINIEKTVLIKNVLPELVVIDEVLMNC